MKCAHCGIEFSSKTRRRYCSDTCSREATNANRRKIFNREGTCIECGSPFVKRLELQKFCSTRCRERWKKRCQRAAAKFRESDPIAARKSAIERRAEEREIASKINLEAQRLAFLDALYRAHEPLKNWQPRRYKIPQKAARESHEFANLILSDWHIGEIVRRNESGGLGEYNADIARERLERCYEAQKRIVEILSAGGIVIKSAIVWLLGDIITGSQVYKGQWQYIDLQVADQIVAAKNLLAELLLNMLDIYPEIRCYCIAGNHGRIEQYKSANITWNNYDWITYRWTADYLRNIKEIKWEISDSWFIVKEIGGWRFCAQHGDDVRMWRAIPWYGLDRDTAEMGAMLWDIQYPLPSYWLYGHFHTAEHAELPHGERIINGSLVGGSTFSARRLRRVSRPSQTFFGLSPKRGITWRYNLYLD